MIGQSAAFRTVERTIAKVAVYDAPVLIEGETGSGKELAARAIHYQGLRREHPFVPVNCGALPDQLIENELFGHRRGAYTDARDNQLGLVALAHRGTLFLDEIDTLSAKGQVVLLRFLQDQQFRPLGGKQEERADIRIIAASNSNLEKRVTSGQFRIDLLHRLKLMHICLPPLRERLGDVPLLAEHFIALASKRFGKPAKPLAPATLKWFERYDWPGNIRELENLVCREFLLSEGAEISVPAPSAVFAIDHPPVAAGPLNYKRAKAQAVNQFEMRFLMEVMHCANGNVSAAARLCGTERRYLGRLLKKHQIARLQAHGWSRQEGDRAADHSEGVHLA